MLGDAFEVAPTEIPMDPTNRSRRGFLAGLASGAVAGSCFEPLAAIDSAFGMALAEFDSFQDRDPLAAIRKAYSLDPRIVYLNHASIGTMPRAVQSARAKYLETCERNPWFYIWGGAWDAALAAVREQAASFLHCRSDEVAFTHNTTEGFNLLAQGLDLGKDDEVLYSSLNHVGASRCWSHFAERRGFKVRRFDHPLDEPERLSPSGVLDLYASRIRPETRVLVLPHVDNVVGIRHPIKQISALAHEKGVEIVAVDGAQSVGMFPVNLAESGVDLYAASPHKWLQAPKGLGLLYVRKSVQSSISPMWVTWGHDGWEGQARIYEDYGTRNLPEVLTLGHALEFHQRIPAAVRDRGLRRLRRRCRDRVLGHPALTWRSPLEWKDGASLFAVEIKGHRSDAVSRKLFADRGFIFRPFRRPGLDSIRLSPNLSTRPEELDALFREIIQLV